MTGMRIKGSEFCRLLCGLRFGGDAEPNAGAGFFLIPSVPSASEVDQHPAPALAVIGRPRR